MSTTVKYKGNALTTVNNQTRTLKTAGKYMEGDVVLTDVSSTAKSYTVNLGVMPDELGQAYIEDSKGVKHYLSNTSFTAQEGEQLYFYAYGSSGANYIYYNNVIVASDTYGVEYHFSMPRYDINVSVSGDTTIGRTMRISTSMLTINKNGYHNVENYGFVDVQAAPIYTATFITTSGNDGQNYVSYTDASGFTTNYYSVGSTFTFSAGDTATFVGTYAGACKRYLNGELISTDTNYVYTLPACNIEIQLQNYNSPSSQYAIQKITTSDGIDALTITQNGTYTASGSTKGYSPITVNISGGTPSLQNKSVTPSESQQSITADEGYTGLGTITVNAIPSTYVGSEITQRDGDDLTASGATVSVPAGYYSAAASKSVATGTEGAPTASKGTVTNHSISITPSVTNTAGYITGGTHSGTAVTVSASELVSGTYSITASGTHDVTNYASASVASGSATVPSTISGTAASVSTGTNTLTLTKTVSVTPTVSAGYITSGTAGNSSVSLTANIAVNPTLTVSGPIVTAPAGYYTENTSQSVATMTPPSEPSNNYTSGYTRLKIIDRATTTRYINIPPGYNSTGVYYQISAVANGHATTPATTITANPTITISDSGLITATASASQSVTPTVSAGYVSSGTAGTITVSGSKTQQLTTKAAATITPTTTNQTIASGTYLTGTQTILGDPDLVGPNIVAGASIFNINGTATFQHYYTGSSAPASSLGENGDIYLQAQRYINEQSRTRNCNK